MAVYTYAQMMSLWIEAAAPKLGKAAATALAPIAAAIGEAESGGNASALNPNDNNGTQSSFGVWQISTGTHTPPSPNWANPAVNASLAVDKYVGAGRSWSPWGTYDSGAYRAFLSPGTSPDPNVPGSADQLTAQASASGAADCLMGNPFTGALGSLPVIGGLVPQSCLFTKSNARAFIGAGLMVAGGLLAFDGGLWIMAGLAMRAASGLLAGASLPLPVPGRGGKQASPVDATSAAPGASARFVAQQVQPPREGLPAAGPKIIPGEVIAA